MTKNHLTGEKLVSQLWGLTMSLLHRVGETVSVSCHLCHKRRLQLMVKLDAIIQLITCCCCSAIFVARPNHICWVCSTGQHTSHKFKRLGAYELSHHKSLCLFRWVLTRSECCAESLRPQGHGFALSAQPACSTLCWLLWVATGMLKLILARQIQP